MPKKKLANKISKKLEKLSKLLDKISEVQVINSNDSETWDSDALYSLIENCKEVVELLEDKEDPKNKDEFGQPLYEEGLCSLVDEYHEEEEESEDY